MRKPVWGQTKEAISSDTITTFVASVNEQLSSVNAALKEFNKILEKIPAGIDDGERGTIHRFVEKVHTAIHETSGTTSDLNTVLTPCVAGLNNVAAIQGFRKALAKIDQPSQQPVALDFGKVQPA